MSYLGITVDQLASAFAAAVADSSGSVYTTNEAALMVAVYNYVVGGG